MDVSPIAFAIVAMMVILVSTQLLLPPCLIMTNTICRTQLQHYSWICHQQLQIYHVSRLLISPTHPLLQAKIMEETICSTSMEIPLFVLIGSLAILALLYWEPLIVLIVEPFIGNQLVQEIISTTWLRTKETIALLIRTDILTFSIATTRITQLWPSMPFLLLSEIYLKPFSKLKMIFFYIYL